MIVCFLLISVVFAQFSPWRLYNVYFRDMSFAHPDVEGPYANNFPQTGLLEDVLDNYGFPSFYPPSFRPPNRLNASYYDITANTTVPPVKNALSSFAISNQGRYFFDEFFINVPGVNIGYNMSLNFTLLDPVAGVYAWERPRFFPLDGLGFGIKEAIAADNPMLAVSQQDKKPHNFGFSTVMSFNFYNRGVEVFSFIGDDDLWIFVDGKLTTCDIGGVHGRASCVLKMADLNLKLNTSYSMTVYQIERHSDQSTFIVQTSVRPENVAPIANNFSAYFFADSVGRLNLLATDAEGSVLEYFIVDKPVFGTLTPSKETGVFIYVPNVGYSGDDIVRFLVSDGEKNSTIGTASIHVLADTQDGTISVPKLVFEVNVGDYKVMDLPVVDKNNVTLQPSQVAFYLLDPPKLGYAKFYPNGSLVYNAVRNGKESFRYSVVDYNNNIGRGTVVGVVNIPDDKKLSGGAIAGIVIGSVCLMSLLFGGGAYYLYHRYAANKFAEAWQSEWAQANAGVNPLFVASTKENVNPLFQS